MWGHIPALALFLCHQEAIMPVRITKVDGFRVSTPGGVKAKSTTKAKAHAQKRIIMAADKRKRA